MAINPLYNVLNRNPGVTGQNSFMGRFQAFKQAFQGNPQEQVQRLLNSGRISQEQYNRAVQMANELSKLMK